MPASTENSKLGRQKRETFADKTFNRVLMEVVGPILIILMIGALVFFLIDIFYRGPHSARLGWVLGLFTIAAVLVSRISIDSGIERAALFGFALASATFVVTVTLVDFEYGNLAFLKPVVVVAFIAVVMWCANRLTWDCTMIDDSRDVSSIGLTELVKRKMLRKEKPKRSPNQSPVDRKPTSPWFALFANSSTRNTPGLWVFYFAIAAFPIFGFGQWFAQPSEGWGYRWIFFLFAVYLGSGLGLLMLTSLLGLERYVNKRGAELPGVVSRTWMVVGTLFALAVMLVMLILPSPSISNGLENALAFLTTNSKEPNKHAVGKDGQKQGDNPNNEKVDNDAKDAEKRDGDEGEAEGKGKDGKRSSSKNGKSKNQNDSKGSQGKGKSQGKDQKSDSKSGDKSSSKSKSEESKGGNRDDSKNDNDAQDKKSGEEKTKDDAQKQGDKGRDQPGKKQEEQPQGQQAKNPPKKQAQQRPNKGDQANPAPAPNPASKLASSVSKSLGSIIKFLVYAIGFVVLLITLWLFREELAKLWNDLFGSKEEKEEAEEYSEKKKRSDKPLPSFESFQEPFANGLASQWTPAQTIQYTFQALEAWGRGYQQPRDQDQTPHEFAKQLNAINKDVATEARRLADLHGQSMFSGDAVDQADASQLKKIWNLMKANSPSHRSALTT